MTRTAPRTPRTPRKRAGILCRQCNQPILMGKWRGRWFPIDPTPHPTGRWARIQGRWRKMVGVRYETALHNNTPLHPNHNCPARRDQLPPIEEAKGPTS